MKILSALLNLDSEIKEQISFGLVASLQARAVGKAFAIAYRDLKQPEEDASIDAFNDMLAELDQQQAGDEWLADAGCVVDKRSLEDQFQDLMFARYWSVANGFRQSTPIKETISWMVGNSVEEAKSHAYTPEQAQRIAAMSGISVEEVLAEQKGEIAKAVQHAISVGRTVARIVLIDYEPPARANLFELDDMEAFDDDLPASVFYEPLQKGFNAARTAARRFGRETFEERIGRLALLNVAEDELLKLCEPAEIAMKRPAKPSPEEVG